MKEKKKLKNIILVLIFLILGLMVRKSSQGILFDLKLLEIIHETANPVVFNIMKFISYLGSENFLIPAMAVIIIYNIFKKNMRESLFLLVNTLGSFVLNFIAKAIFQRARPLDFSLVKQGGLSYPSGHSMVVMSMYLAIFYLLTRNIKDENKRIFIGIIVGIYILLMGISRMYLGVHWPTDIIGGYILGYLLYDMSKKILDE